MSREDAIRRAAPLLRLMCEKQIEREAEEHSGRATDRDASRPPPK